MKVRSAVFNIASQLVIASLVATIVIVPVPASAAGTGIVTRQGTSLTLDGQPFRFTGMNIYNANSDGSCLYAMDGTILSDSLTAIGTAKVIRAWFFQQMATKTGARDWTAFDRTLATARARGVRVIATLANQWPDCDAGYGYKNDTWYQTGYKTTDPWGTVSYRDWVAEVAGRYKDDAAVLAWQLINEAEVKPNKDSATCSAGAAQTLKAFASDVSSVIKSADATHLVSLGTIGNGQCGAQGDEYFDVHDLPNIDLCEYHDYNSPGVAMPGDRFNGLDVRLQQCAALNKPLFVGETGIKPSDVGGTLQGRADAFQAKFLAQIAAGVVGELVWDWNKDASNPSGYEVGPGDPTLSLFSRDFSFGSTFAIQDFAISHDGAHLAFVGTVNSVYGLFRANRDGSQARLLSSASDRPMFTPDDQTIVYGAPAPSGTGGIWKIAATGGVPISITNTPGVDEESPGLSPDGRTAVAASADAASNNTVDEIRQIDLATGTETLILNNYPNGVNPPHGASWPTFTNDAARVLFVANAGDAYGGWTIHSIPISGGTPTQVSTTPGGRMDVSNLPGNRGQIVFVSNYKAIYTMNPDGSNVTLILNGADNIDDVHWTPGGQIAYVSSTFDSATGLSSTWHIPADPVVRPVDATSGPVTVSSDISQTGATPTSPVQASVTVPQGTSGTVSIDTSGATTTPPPSNYTFLSQQVSVDAPLATAANPLVLTFSLDYSILAAAGVDAGTVQITRTSVADGTVLISACTGSPPAAAPDPCVESRTTTSQKDAVITVRTSHASVWNFAVRKKDQTITFGPLGNKTYGDAPFAVSASASSGLPVSFGVGGTDHCTISGSTVTITGAGSCSVTASQAGNSTYASAPTVVRTFAIAKASTTNLLSSSANPSFVNRATIFRATVSGPAGTSVPTGTVTFSDGTTRLGQSALDSSGVAALAVTFSAPGHHQVTAAYGSDGNFSSSTSAVMTQLVKANKIAFHSNRDGNAEIYVMDASGANQTRLTVNAAADSQPALSPDGTRIAFVSTRSGSPQIWVMNAVPNAPAKRLTFDGASDSVPTWSPDGKMIAYAGTATGQWQLWAINSAGGTPVRLLKDAFQDVEPAWSPDGTRIAFVSNRGGKPQLWTIGYPTAGIPKRITTEAVSARMSWSPDGSKIAFASNASGSSQIWLVDSTGATPATQLTHDALTADAVPTWSPDGTEIAFNGATSARTEIFKISVSGSGELRLTSGPPNNGGPNWCCLTAP